MNCIDFHCDTLLLNNTPKEGESLVSNSMSVDFVRMQKADYSAQFFAVFLPTPRYFKRNQLPVPDDWDYVAMQLDHFHKDISSHPEMIGLALSWKDYDALKKQGKMAAFLTIEDGRLINGSAKKIETIRELGIRLLTLTWNNPNCFGYPQSEDPNLMALGLTDFGKESISILNEAGILIDVSHLSDGGFWDVIQLSRQPILASHSNARAVSSHPRNLTDEMIKAIASKGGCAGLNFDSQMLSFTQGSTVETMAAHLRHMIQVGGIEFPALGTDFDGIHGEREISECSLVPLLWEKLPKYGFTASEIEHIAYKNAERLIREVLVK